jgi:hypothetical protein
MARRSGYWTSASSPRVSRPQRSAAVWTTSALSSIRTTTPPMHSQLGWPIKRACPESHAPRLFEARNFVFQVFTHCRFLDRGVRARDHERGETFPVFRIGDADHRVVGDFWMLARIEVEGDPAGSEASVLRGGGGFNDGCGVLSSP